MTIDIGKRPYPKRSLRKRAPLEKFGFAVLSVLACAVLALLASGMSHATDLPVVHKSGTLSEDETWSAGSVYLVDGTVSIPTGITLTIDHGAIVKYASLFSGSILINGGMLDVTGTSGDPVIFTSAQDDSAGGDSTTNGATSGTIGDYHAAIMTAGGTVNVAHAYMEYGQHEIVDDGNNLGGSLTVTDSTLGHVQYAAIDHRYGPLSLERNTFNLQDGSGTDALEVTGIPDLSGIVLSGTDKNIFTATRIGGTVVANSGTVPIGATWSVATASGALLAPGQDDIYGTLNLSDGTTYLANASYPAIRVQNGGTVTAPAGAVLKVYHYVAATGIQVNTGGTLDVNGTGVNPVTFTSAEDDSLGGDTTTDGSTTASVGDYRSAIVTAGGAVNVAHANMTYGQSAVIDDGNNQGGSLTITDSTLSHLQYTAIDHRYGPLSLERNAFNLQDGSGDQAVSATGIPDLSNIVLSGADKNTFTASRVGGRTLGNSGTVPVGSTWDVATASGVLLAPGQDDVYGTLNLPSGVTYLANSSFPAIRVQNGGVVTVPASATLKVYHYVAATGIQVNTGGTLNVDGTNTDPVTFTSAEDDSAGGDSTGDGSTTASVGDYRAAIVTAGGTANVVHANMAYGQSAIIDDGNNLGGSLTVADSTLSHLQYTAIDHRYGPLSLERNTFNLQDGSGDQAVSATGIPDLSNIVLSGTNKNTFTATRVGGRILGNSGTVPVGSIWDVATASGVLLAPGQDDVYGILNLSGDVTYLANSSFPAVRVQNGGMVTAPAGATLKVYHYASATGIQVNTGGTLNANGTNADPVTFTSAEDDSAGGDSTGDGSTTAAVGDYGKAIDNEGGDVDATYVDMKYGGLEYLQTDGRANFEHTNIDHATTGLQVNNGNATYRGSIHNVSDGIYACNWQFSCSVDAAYVDWGSADGPFPSSGNLVCGTVTVNPWTYGSNTYMNVSIFAVGACNSSQPPDAQLGARITAYQNHISLLDIDCGNGYQSACDAITTYNACIQAAWDVAKHNAPFSFPTGSPISDPVSYETNFLSAASSYIESIEEGSVTGMTFGVGGELLGTVSLVTNLNSAYDNCL